ncbi:hypothetical protein [Streptomyces sp. NPDC002067]
MSARPDAPKRRFTYGGDDARASAALGEADASRGRADEFEDRGLTPDAADARTTSFVENAQVAEHSADARRVEAANSYSSTVEGPPTGRKAAAPEQAARVPPVATRKAQLGGRRIP